MDNQPSIDRSILLPILIGAFSIFGILILLLISRVSASRAVVPTAPTATAFKFEYLGTEPGPTGTASPEGTASDLFTSTPFEGIDETPTLPRTAVVTPTIGTPNVTSGGPPDDGTDGPPIDGTSPANTGVPTSTSASGPPMSAGAYDNVDSHLVYDGPGWEAQQVATAYNGTLHVSFVPASSVTFRFIGTQVRFTYLAGDSLGEVTITIDNNQNLTFTVDQSELGNNEWASPILSNATHTVLIEHESGGSINLDSVIIPAAATPTPTPTRTLRP